jgi:hypothetical protein
MRAPLNPHAPARPCGSSPQADAPSGHPSPSAPTATFLTRVPAHVAARLDASFHFTDTLTLAVEEPHRGLDRLFGVVNDWDDGRVQ